MLLDVEEPKLAENMAKLLNTLWSLLMTKVEMAGIYATMWRVYKTRLTPEMEMTRLAGVKENDATLAAA